MTPPTDRSEAERETNHDEPGEDLSIDREEPDGSQSEPKPPVARSGTPDGDGAGRDDLAPNRRDFMKVGGLAAGGLLASSGLAGAADAGVAEVETEATLQQESDPDIGGVIFANLFYGDEDIQGESQFTDLAGIEVSASSDVLALDWDVEVVGATNDPRRPGRQTTSDLVVAKRVDSASVPLYQRYQTTEPLDLTVEFFRLDSEGVAENYYRFDLTNVRVLGVEFTTRATPGVFPHLEIVTFSPQRVVVSDGLTGASVEFQAPSPST